MAKKKNGNFGSLAHLHKIIKQLSSTAIWSIAMATK
jgi:hypothetical protein